MTAGQGDPPQNPPPPPPPPPSPPPPPQNPPPQAVTFPGEEFRQFMGAMQEMPGKIAEAVAGKVFGTEQQIADTGVQQQTAQTGETVKPATQHWFWRTWGGNK